MAIRLKASPVKPAGESVEAAKDESLVSRDQKLDAQVQKAFEYFLGGCSREAIDQALLSEWFTGDVGYFLNSRRTGERVTNRSGELIFPSRMGITSGAIDRLKQNADLISAFNLLVVTIQKGGASPLSSLVTACLQSASPLEQERLSLALAMQAGQAPALIEAVKLVQDTQRKCEFRATFLESFGREPISKLRASLDGFALIDAEDSSTRAEFLEYLRVRRQTEALVAAVGVLPEVLSSSSGDQAGTSSSADPREGLIKSLGVLTSSKSDLDQKSALNLIEIASRIEIANFQSQALRLSLSDGVTSASPEADASTLGLGKFVAALPLRASVGQADYRSTIEKLRDFSEQNEALAVKLRQLQAANRVRELYKQRDFTGALAGIKSFDCGLDSDPKVQKILFEEVRAAAAGTDTSQFDTLFAGEIRTQMNGKLLDQFNMPKLGNNAENAAYLFSNFRQVFNPWLQTLRNDPSSRAAVNAILRGDEPGEAPRATKLPFEIRLEELRKQRPLTEIEETYLKSVEILSRLNPAIVSVLTAAPSDTFEYLRMHFERLSKSTKSELTDGAYVPNVMIGFGVHGIAAMGEITRLSSSLAEQTLIVDQGEVPGGPFSVPGGPAWELNSANNRGGNAYKLPNPPSGVDEKKTVRGWGSPLRWYPGERNGSSVRAGGINTVVDYLSSVDGISTLRYPTNHEFALVVQASAALLAGKLALRTTFLGVEKNTDPIRKGDKVVSLSVQESDGKSRVVRIYTDGLMVSTGLGDANYGFVLKGSRAEKIANEEVLPGRFPRLSSTLTAFKALADERVGPAKKIGDTIVIWGSGNSADTILENLGSLFAGSNPIVRQVARIVVISEADFSARARYARILDLKPRNGQGNLVEIVKGRVSDVDNALGAQGKLIFFGSDGNPIKDGTGKEIQADHGIAAAGFRSGIRASLARYTGVPIETALQPVGLPTDQAVVIGETLAGDANVLLVGTAAKPDFITPAKKLQLPSTAANALGRVSAENAVAIGFRAPETQAAIRSWVWSRDFDLEARTALKASNVLIDPSPLRIDIRSVKLTESEAVEEPDRLASGILGYLLKSEPRQFLAANGDRYTGKVTFTIRKDGERGLILAPSNSQGAQAKEPLRSGIFSSIVKLGSGSRASTVRADFAPEVTTTLSEVLTQAFEDPYLTTYVLKALEGQRRDPLLNLDITFANGQIHLPGTLIEK